MFPTLKGLVNLCEEVVDIPDFFTRNNRESFAYCLRALKSTPSFPTVSIEHYLQGRKMPMHNARSWQ